MPCLCEDCQLDRERCASTLPYEDVRIPERIHPPLCPSTTLARALSHLQTSRRLIHELLESGQVDNYHHHAVDAEANYFRQLMLDLAANELYVKPA